MRTVYEGDQTFRLTYIPFYTNASSYIWGLIMGYLMYTGKLDTEWTKSTSVSKINVSCIGGSWYLHIISSIIETKWEIEIINYSDTLYNKEMQKKKLRNQRP